jgi:hypothetical protein
MHIAPTVAIASATTGVFAALPFLPTGRADGLLPPFFLSGAAAGVIALVWMWGR